MEIAPIFYKGNEVIHKNYQRCVVESHYVNKKGEIVYKVYKGSLTKYIKDRDRYFHDSFEEDIIHIFNLSTNLNKKFVHGYDISKGEDQ